MAVCSAFSSRSALLTGLLLALLLAWAAVVAGADSDAPSPAPAVVAPSDEAAAAVAELRAVESARETQFVVEMVDALPPLPPTQTQTPPAAAAAARLKDEGAASQPQDEKKNEKKEQLGPRTVRMADKDGRQFDCLIPATPVEDDDDDDASEDATPGPTVLPDWAALVKQALGNGCFTKTEGYWSYEVCPFKNARQFHREPNGVIGVSFSLGAHEAAADAQNSADAPYVQTFTGGTDNRRLVVHFRCASAAAGAGAGAGAWAGAGAGATGSGAEHLLVSVLEPKPFSYVAEIRTPLVCSEHSKSGSPLSSNVMDLLAPLANTCQHLNTGWWLYKFCFLRSVHQLHREQRTLPSGAASAAASSPSSAAASGESSQSATPAAAQGQQAQDAAVQPQTLTLVMNEGGRVTVLKGGGAAGLGAGAGAGAGLEWHTTVEYDMGHMSAQATAEQLEAATTIVKGDTVAETYVSQTYTDGTECDLTRHARRTEVRFFCDANEPLAAVESVQESRSCEYVLRVRSSLLCAHRLFSERPPRVLTVLCAPAPTPTPAADAGAPGAGAGAGAGAAAAAAGATNAQAAAKAATEAPAAAAAGVPPQ